MGYSWDIHGVFICVGYVSVMYRLCIGNITEEKSSEGVTKKQVKNRANHGLARMGTETRDMIPPTPTARDLNYLNQKMGIFINKDNNKHPCAGAQKAKLSKPKMRIFINKENNKHPCAGAQKTKLSKPKAT